jgi:hypothetical protein
MTDPDTDTDNGNDNNGQTLSDVECREEALSGVRDAIAALQGVPAVGLDAEKHETIRDSTSDLQGIERALTHEVTQMKDNGGRDE